MLAPPRASSLPFVENWAGEVFGAYVAYLEGELDTLAAAASREERERIRELFELTTRCEIVFCEITIAGETWPGVPERR